MIKIVKPLESDVINIQQVFYETWLATYPNDEIGISIEDIEERFKDRFSTMAIQKRTEEILDKSVKKLFVIARDGGAVVGVCKAEKMMNHNELCAIYVLPTYHRNGIGTMMWKRIVEFFGNEKDIIVRVASYNLQAISFYNKLGFIDTGKRFTQENLRMPISGVYIPETELIIKSITLG